MRRWKRRVKSGLGSAMFRTGSHRRSLGNRALIVLFHRVDDTIPPNPTTCSPALFERYCIFFRRYFQVISLQELLDRLETGRDVGGTLVITFDDGYLDNREVAAPILLSHGLPATFFVATGFIGTSLTPWWDEQWGVPSKWMGWSEVRELVELGFEIGAHTVNHPDLGQVHGDEARWEILESRDTLERELGIPVPSFCYPYGGRHQITEENRNMVRELGFRSCLSAYGGFVDPEADRYDLRRVAISPWHISPSHFGWEILHQNE